MTAGFDVLSQPDYSRSELDRFQLQHLSGIALHDVELFLLACESIDRDIALEQIDDLRKRVSGIIAISDAKLSKETLEVGCQNG
jgi:hypothetical protein